MYQSGGRPPKDTRESSGVVCSYGEVPVCPAMDLFVNGEVLQVVEDSLMDLGTGLLTPADERLVQSIVVTSFKNISRELHAHAPEVAGELEMMQLSELQKDSVIAAMKLVANRQVQSLGLEVARAIRDSPSADRADLLLAIETQLRPKLASLMQLKNELVPASLRTLWGSDHQWDMTLDPESVKTMRGNAREFAEDTQPATTVDLARKSFSILGGVLEEGRALIDAIKLCTRMFGSELAVPNWATSLIGKAGPRLETCELDAPMDSKLDFMKALFCPLKFGTAGLDALRAAGQMVADEDTREAKQERGSTGSNEEDRSMLVGHPPEHTLVQAPPTPAPVMVIGHPAERTRVEHSPATCKYGPMLVCPARDLFDSAEVVDLVAEGLTTVGQGSLLAEGDGALVHDIATSGMWNFSGALDEQAPEVAGHLRLLQLSEEQRDAVLASLRLLAHPRVRDLGLAVASAIRASPYGDDNALRGAVEDALRPRLREIIGLRDELVPESLQQLWGTDSLWDIAFDKQSVAAVRASRGPLAERYEPASGHMGFDAKFHGLASGVLEEACALLDVLRLCTHTFGAELRASGLRAALLGSAAQELLRCEGGAEGNAAATHSPGAQLESMKALFCPLRLGGFGLDALRAIPEMEKAAAMYRPARSSAEGGEGEGEASQASARPACSYEASPVCPASDLFEDMQVQAVVIASLMRVGTAVLHRDEDDEVVRYTAAECFRNIYKSMADAAPEAKSQLETLQLSQLQKNAVLTSLWLLSDFRVQAVGKQVAKAIRDSDSEEPEDVKRAIEEHMRDHVLQVQNLRDELVPAALLELWGEGHQWEMTLEADNIKAMRMVEGDFADGTVSSNAKVDLEKKTYAVFGGALEEGRALLDLVRLATRFGGEELAVPIAAASTASGEGGPKLMACSADAGETQEDFMKALYCPLKYGAQGLDALRAVAEITREMGKDELGRAASSHSHIGHPPEHPRSGEHDTGPSPQASTRCVYSQVDQCSVPDLFESPELLEVAAVGIMRVGHGLLAPADIGAVRDAVATGFANISKNLVAGNPLLASADRTRLDKDGMHAVLTSLWLVSDERVEDIGRAVAQAIESSSSADKDQLKQRIADALQDQHQVMADVRAELIPEALLQLWRQGPKWAFALSDENIKSLRGGTGDFLGGDPSMLGAVDVPGKSFAILGGVLEEGRAVIDIISLLTGLFTNGDGLSAWDDELAGKVSLSFDSCQRTVRSSAPLDFMQSLFCPLKFGVLGLDALRALADAAAAAAPRPEASLAGEVPHPAAPHRGGEPTCAHSGLPMCVMLDLFEHPEVVDVAAGIVLRVGRGMFVGHDDRAMVREVVAASFRNISEQLQARVPDVAGEMKKLLLSELQKKAVLASMELLANEEVQSIGLDVAHGIHEAALSKEDFREVTRDFVSDFVEEKLRGRLPELVHLRKTLVPSFVRALWGNQHQWDMTLDPENIGTMLGGSGKFASAFKLESSLSTEKKHDAILGAVLELGRAFIDLIKVCTRSYGKELAIPPWATSMTGQVSPELLSCQRDLKGDEQVEAMKTLFCPLKYGSQGLEALRAMPEMEDKFVAG
ncbi:unnamed protein product [Prorocentrum cordatum]|uniref:Uncharacterized protein n=1 Tax=Prorocentrum cordatum TaxID=2364126 RepID=A0ABN9Q5G8_9DINO|nr:unnamed protein product [Polarella glacialis]